MFHKYRYKRRLLQLILISFGFILISILTLYSFVYIKYIRFIPGENPINKSNDPGENIDCSNFENDSPFLIENLNVNKKWILLGKEFSEKEKTVTVKGNFSDKINKYLLQGNNPNTRFIIKEIDHDSPVEIINENRNFEFTYKFEDIKPAEYSPEMTVEVSCGKFVSTLPKVTLSYPVYISWTLDYEGFSIPSEHLQQIKQISDQYQIPLTHFYNARIYTNPDLTDGAKSSLTEWILSRQNENREPIGLHLHMFPDLLNSAGVIPHEKDPTWGGWRTDGYSILVTAYNYEEMDKLIKYSKSVFAEKGIRPPSLYRSGGWFADSDTLKVVQDNGFLADSSGRTKYILDTGGPYGPWDLNPDAQPYKPNTTRQNTSEAPNMSIWEFPNNGGDSYAYSADQLFERFKLNYNGVPLEYKRLVTYLSHPEWYYIDKTKMEQLWQNIDQYSYTKDQGPVIFITQERALEIWNM